MYCCQNKVVSAAGWWGWGYGRIFYSHWDTLKNNSKRKGTCQKRSVMLVKTNLQRFGHTVVTVRTGDNIIYMEDFLSQLLASEVGYQKWGSLSLHGGLFLVVVGVQAQGGVPKVGLLLFTWRTPSRSCWCPGWGTQSGAPSWGWEWAAPPQVPPATQGCLISSTLHSSKVGGLTRTADPDAPSENGPVVHVPTLRNQILPKSPKAEFMNEQFRWGFWALFWEFSDLGFPDTMLTLQTSFKSPLLKAGEGGGIRL